MFGILKPRHDLLARQDCGRHTAAYCNLCGLLSSQYGFKSRLLVVHDIATLWWLLETPSEVGERTLPVGNCVRGGSRRLRQRGLSDVQKFLVAMSVYMIGVKVTDDFNDGRNWKTCIVNMAYRSLFKEARVDLIDVGFNLAQLEEILDSQVRLEREGILDFKAAAVPTAQAYGLVAREIAKKCKSPFTLEQAQQTGEKLGRAVYLVDAIQDFNKDQGKEYNPLCLAAEHTVKELPFFLRECVLTHMGGHLAEGRRLVQNVSENLKNSWHAIERSLLAAAGVHDQKSVTLYIGCCCPCSDGGDQGDCNQCDCYCGFGEHMSPKMMKSVHGMRLQVTN